MVCRPERPAKWPQSRVPDPSDIGSPISSDSVAELAQLYLGNILYAIERCAVSLDDDDKLLDAAFYRGIGRKLAAAHRAGRADL